MIDPQKYAGVDLSLEIWYNEVEINEISQE